MLVLMEAGNDTVRAQAFFSLWRRACNDLW